MWIWVLWRWRCLRKTSEGRLPMSPDASTSSVWRENWKSRNREHSWALQTHSISKVGDLSSCSKSALTHTDHCQNLKEQWWDNGKAQPEVCKDCRLSENFHCAVGPTSEIMHRHMIKCVLESHGSLYDLKDAPTYRDFLWKQDGRYLLAKSGLRHFLVCKSEASRANAPICIFLLEVRHLRENIC